MPNYHAFFLALFAIVVIAIFLLVGDVMIALTDENLTSILLLAVLYYYQQLLPVGNKANCYVKY